LLYLAASLGVKMPLHARVSLYGAATLHWAEKDIFDFETSGQGRGEADRTDLTLDLGARYFF
jgi:hypothetical protein